MAGGSSGKFKVGDRVRRLAPSEWPHQFGEAGEEYTVLAISDVGLITVIPGAPGADPDMFESVADSPTRTVTRREIVPGNYKVGGTILHIFNDFGALLDDWSDAVACREAARIFNEIADVLEENANG